MKRTSHKGVSDRLYSPYFFFSYNIAVTVMPVKVSVLIQYQSKEAIHRLRKQVQKETLRPAAKTPLIREPHLEILIKTPSSVILEVIKKSLLYRPQIKEATIL